VPISSDSPARASIRLSPAAFEALVQHVVEELAERRGGPREEDRLPEPEAAALRRAGLVRAPLSPDAPDSVAGLAAAYAALMASSLSVSEAAQRLRVDPSRVRQRLTERTLFGFKERGTWRLPAFQFDAAGTVPGLEVVVPRVDPGLHPVAVERWFTLPCPDLEIDERAVSPRDWLRAGGSAEVVAEIAAEIV
jgi:hypothetical protein